MPTPSHRSARRRGMLMGAALSSRSKKKAAVQPAQAPVPAPVAAPSNDLTGQLTELKNLLDQGILTQDEFEAKKKKILGL